MRICYKLLAALWSLWLARECIAAMVGKVRGSVDLPCTLQPLQYPIEQIMVYWQVQHHGKDLVVAMAWNGSVDYLHQDIKYRGRADLNPQSMRDGNFNLHLSNLSFKDNGTYECIIFWTPSSTSIIKKMSENLKVTGTFSPPFVLNETSKATSYGEEHTLKCTSEGGDQRPGVKWINSSSGTEIQEGRIHNDIQKDSDIIKVTSTISINLTSSMNISCVITTDEENITSQSYNMLVTVKVLDGERGVQVQIIIMIPIIILALIAIISIIMYYSKRSVPRVMYHGGHVTCDAPRESG